MNTHLLSIIYKWLKKTTNGNQFLIIIGVSVYVFFEIFGYRIWKELWESGNTPLLILYYSPLVLISLYLFYNYQKGLNKKIKEQVTEKNKEGVLDFGLGSLIGLGIIFTLDFTFGKLNKRYLDKRLKEKDDEE